MPVVGRQILLVVGRLNGREMKGRKHCGWG